VPTPSSNDDENKIRWSFAPRASSSSSSSSSSDDDAAPADASEDDALRARAMALRARAIKSYLALMSVASANLFEKEELAKALADAWIEKRSKTVNLPLRQIVGMPGNPRAGYVVVTLDLPGDAGFVDFLVDSGATTAIVSPRLREMLGASATDGAAIRGLGAMGETVRQKVTIDGVGVGSVRIGALDAVVTDLDASGLPAVVGGLLGLEFLSKARSVLIRTGSHTTAFAW
jgi:predicted aspartyl protease